MLCGLFAGLTQQCWASGFAITGKSTSSLGHAVAGTTVVADDATVVFSNPALMQSLHGDNISVALHSIIPSVQFENEGSTTNTATSSTSTTGPTNEQIDKIYLIPNFYYVTELRDDVRFGLGIYTPFGLGLEYNDNWVGRYQTTNSSLRTINISPAFSFAASDKLSLGMGIDIQYATADLRNAVDFGGICENQEAYLQALGYITSCSAVGLAAQQNDGSQTLTGDHWALGYSMGMTYDFNQSTRMGVTFHSATRHDVKGTSEFNNVPTLFASTFRDTDASLSIMLPENLSIGVRHAITPRLDLLADYTWTRWSRYDELVVHFDSGLPLARSEQNWKDVPRYSIGMDYQWKDDWKIRAGASYDKTPIPDAEHRSPRVPDSDKLTLALGSKLGLSDKLDLDIALTYTLPAKADINTTDSTGHTLSGNYEVDTSYVSMQLDWKL